MNRPKTILITCFFGLVARDILGTDVLEILRSRRDLRIVILCPEKKKALLESQFAGPNVIVEGIPGIPLGVWERISYAIFRDLLATDTRKTLRLVELKKTGNYWKYWLSGLIAFWGRFPAAVKLARRFFGSVRPPAAFLACFKKYRPDLLFSTDIMVMGDIRSMRAARRSEVAVAGMVRSWDNLTVYQTLPLVPESVIVQNQTIKDELLRYQFFPDRNIRLVGIPHYDQYVRERRTSRGEFFRKMGLDPKKKTVFFTPTAIKHWGDPELNVAILKILSSLDVNVLARLPVMGELDLAGFAVPANVILDKPIRTKESVDAELNAEANRHLADSLFHSDVVVTGPSTIIIDAVVFDKPVIYVDFDSRETPYWKSATRFHQYNHIQMILDTGGVKVAASSEELRRSVEEFLKNPELDAAGRRALALQKRWQADGQSSERLAGVLLENL